MLQEDSYHNIAVNDEGLCTLCEKKKEFEKIGWDKLKSMFEERIESIRGKGDYDGLIMWSGGKDSAYLAYFLKVKYGLNLFGFIVDNNYEYEDTFENADNIAKSLDMPYMKYRQDPALMKEYYRFLFMEKSIYQQDAGQVCAFCGRFLIYTASCFAGMMNIPAIFSGHSPDQIFLMGESIEIDEERIAFKEYVMETFYHELKKARNAWEKEKGLKELDILFPKDIKTNNVQAIFPFQYFPYKPQEMIKIVKRELSWEPIKRFSENYISSGCKLVNLWSRIAHLNNTNNYVDFEFGNQIRDGLFSREYVDDFKQTLYDKEEIERLAIEFEMPELVNGLEGVEKERKDKSEVGYLMIREVISDIVSEIIGVEKEEIDVYESIIKNIDDFSVLLKITEDIEDRFGIDNKVDNFLDGGTIHDMSLSIERCMKARDVEPAAGDDRVIMLQSSAESDAMLFCLPYAGGMTEMFEKFSECLPDTVNVGIALYPGVRGEGPPLETIEEIAEFYAEYLMSVKADVLYVLGYCFGGYVAHHLVRILARRNRRVDGLIMVSLAPPNLKDTVYDLDFDATACTDGYMKGTMKIGEIYRGVTDAMSEEELKRYWSLYWKSVKTILDYKVSKEAVDMPALIVTGKDEEYDFLRPEDKAWLELYPNAGFATVAGGHMLLVTHPEELANCIMESTGIGSLTA